MRVLVTAASRHGSTAEIARAIAAQLGEAGCSATTRRPEEVDSLEGYDAVVLGSGVYAGRWVKEAVQFIERHRAALLARPVWLFSSGPIGGPVPKPEGDPPDGLRFAEELSARGHRTFAGSLWRRDMGLAERAVVSLVRAPDGDYRDWQAIGAWANAISAEVMAVAVSA